MQRVCLTGGEVFTRPGPFDLMDGVAANRMRYRRMLEPGAVEPVDRQGQRQTVKQRSNLCNTATRLQYENG